MKKKFFLAMITIISILYVVHAYDKKWHTKKPCQCFCAFKMNVRDKEEKDRPFMARLTNSRGKTFDICVCAQRDLERLQKNPLLIDHITDNDIAAANCCNR